ncbi:RNA polymerase sigma factor [Mucilaginibacter psychrotolerans]|uniref:Sigma-70 family RNA polymerase sigma factor n=1 Tax=Mucilaginibacter psychrotolerans TaxID=1524096 RepID=A0A4Y8SD32_9SPHI|nr:sigma-70 family RNA polymerase sigma factor [Mucilaginibacter psychrotolerans]TFF36571.1 sigma-70 family RNA polymerase sigma factor [Mucilaginibacter psychrotolerans]
MSLFFNQEEKLINGCKANERQAQEGLYKRFHAEMLRLCFRYLKSDELAGEALNAAFLKVFQHIGEFDLKKGELGAWVRTITVRTCIDLGRKEAKFYEIKGYKDTDDIFIIPAVLDKLFAEDMLKLIRVLPEATQLVFNLAVIDGYSHKEIGEQLGISESTSRWHLSEAKKQLRQMLSSAEQSIDKPTENKEAK